MLVALSDLTDDQWMTRLLMKRAAQYGHQFRMWQYYDNEQPLRYVAKIIAEQGDRFPPLLINWAALVVDALEERLDVLGFRDPKDDSIDETLQQVWQDNNLDEGSGEAHVCSMATGQSYIMVGPPPPGRDTPVVTVEYPDQMTVEVDPVTRRPVAALKVWRTDPGLGHADISCLYLPGRMVTFLQGKKVDQVGDHGWAKAAEAYQSNPLIPIVPMNNRQRRGCGYTELKALLPLVDAANQIATNMLAAIEHHALPRRWGIGLSEADFKDSNGNPLRAWQIATGAVWAIGRAVDENGRPVPASESERPQVGQFTAADVTNFHNSIKQVATLAGAQYGLPPHYMGYSSENPASADAIRSSEARLVKRAERHQRGKGGCWETSSRIALTMMGEDPVRANRLETWWRDPSTPTAAAQADRALKLTQAGIIDVEQAQEDAGYTPGQIARMRARREQTGRDISGIVDNLRTLPVGRNQPPQDPADPGAEPPVPVLNGASAGAGR